MRSLADSEKPEDDMKQVMLGCAARNSTYSSEIRKSVVGLEMRYVCRNLSVVRRLALNIR